MSKTKYWIWLSMALGAGARTDEILSAYPDPEKLYNDSRTERALSGAFTKAKLDKLEKASLSDAENIIDICKKNGWEIIVPDSPDYPEMLKRLPDMPLVLFVDGDIGCLENKIAIGVVGTRNPTYDSIEIAKKLSSEMSGCGAVIVSGGALGIDSAAHEGALLAGEPTVCVLGCGLGTRYLVSNEIMRQSIAQNGALVTEYPPFTPADRKTFPLRNRIISGLSHGVLVVEAGEKSGSLITARFAVEQGKEVFAVPGSILNGAYTGANRLIRDGAKAVTCVSDILSPFEQMFPDKLDTAKKSDELPKATPKHGDKKANRKKSVPSGLDADSQAVYAVLGDEPLHSDEICVMSGLSPSKVITSLTILEMSGLIEQIEGNNYILS